MSNARLFTNTVLTLAAAATLSVAACEKPPSTSPDEGATPAVDDDDDEVEAPATGDDDEAEAAEPLTKASFDETVHDHFDEVSDCYVAALEGNAKLQGKLNAEFTIGEDGQVLGVTAVDDSTLTDEGLLACINQAAASWTFALPPKGEMTLRYLFDLAPGS